MEAQAKDMPYPDCPFLLLDVRDRDAYDQCHIVGGEDGAPWQPSVSCNRKFSSLGRVLSFLLPGWTSLGCRMLSALICVTLPSWEGGEALS